MSKILLRIFIPIVEWLYDVPCIASNLGTSRSCTCAVQSCLPLSLPFSILAKVWNLFWCLAHSALVYRISNNCRRSRSEDRPVVKINFVSSDGKFCSECVDLCHMFMYIFFLILCCDRNKLSKKLYYFQWYLLTIYARCLFARLCSECFACTPDWIPYLGCNDIGKIFITRSYLCVQMICIQKLCTSDIHDSVNFPHNMWEFGSFFLWSQAILTCNLVLKLHTVTQSIHMT
jgi:hypothetical protein